MRAGVAVDDWKLPTFRKLLTEAGYTYTEGPGLTFETSMMYVETNDLASLKTILENCQAQCRKIKQH